MPILLAPALRREAASGRMPLWVPSVTARKTKDGESEGIWELEGLLAKQEARLDRDWKEIQKAVTQQRWNWESFRQSWLLVNTRCRGHGCYLLVLP